MNINRSTYKHIKYASKVWKVKYETLTLVLLEFQVF